MIIMVRRVYSKPQFAILKVSCDFIRYIEQGRIPSNYLWIFEVTLHFYMRYLDYSMSLEDNKLENDPLISLEALLE